MARAIPDHTPGRLTYYALAVLLSGLALALTLLLEPLMERSIFLLFIAAIVVSALYGGLGPGLVAVFLSTSASGPLCLVQADIATTSFPDILRPMLRRRLSLSAPALP